MEIPETLTNENPWPNTLNNYKSESPRFHCVWHPYKCYPNTHAQLRATRVKCLFVLDSCLTIAWHELVTWLRQQQTILIWYYVECWRKCEISRWTPHRCSYSMTDWVFMYVMNCPYLCSVYCCALNAVCVCEDSTPADLRNMKSMLILHGNKSYGRTTVQCSTMRCVHECASVYYVHIPSSTINTGQAVIMIMIFIQHASETN